MNLLPLHLTKISLKSCRLLLLRHGLSWHRRGSCFGGRGSGEGLRLLHFRKISLEQSRLLL